MNNVIQQSQTGKKTRGVFFFRLWIGFLIYLMGGFPTLVFALPQDGEIVSGTGSIATSGSDMVVHQTSDKLIADWQSFSIGNGESVEFKQPSASSIALNNVIGLSPSVILGSLKSNGQVFLSNGSGVIFGQGAQVNVGGLLATTLSITNEDFLAGSYNFTQDASRPLSSVINRGLIEASYVGLLAPGVENTGTIVANLGSVAMVSGKTASMDFVGDGLINFAITEAVDGDVLDDEGNVIGHRVENSGLIQADGGRVVLSAKDAGNIIQNVVNNEGIIEAHSVVERNGEIFLMGGDSGVVANSGTLDASGKESGQTGGTVHVTGEFVGLFDNAKVDVSADAGGGEVLIGGDYQGKNKEVQNAKRTYIGEDVVIDASAGAEGYGGKVIVWADEVTRFYGSIYATAGVTAGDGGFVEVSGKGSLDFRAKQIDLSAPNGVDGTLLLDPLNIILISGVDSNTTGFTPGVDQTEAFADDAGLTSVFNVDAGGSFAGVTGTIELQATNDITVSSAWDLATSTGNSNVNVVLRAGNDINVIADITLDGTGTITLEADGNTADGAGDVNIASGVGITTANQAVNITANDIDLAGFINAGSGDVAISISTAGQIQIGDATFCPTCAMVITGQELENITAANLTIENTTDAIFVDNITAANSNNVGMVILSANGNVEFGRDALDLDSSVFNALRVLSDAEVLVREGLETDTGNLELTADVDGDGGLTDQLTFKSSPTLISAGDITLNASPSSLVGIFSTAQITMTAAGTITVNDDFDGNSLVFLTANNGIIINGDFASSSMVLDGDANGLADGTDQVTFAAGINVDAKSNTGHITLYKSEALGSISFSSGGGMDLLGDFTANGAVSIDADTHVGVGTGLFSIASGVELNTNNNTLYLRTSEIDLQGAINVGSSDATIEIAQDGTTRKVFLGDGSTCTNCLAISGAELQNITAGTLIIENSGKSNNIYNVSAANSANIGTVILTAQTDNIFLNSSTFNALTVNSKREVYVGAAITTMVGDIIFNVDTNATGGAFDRVFFVSSPTLTSAANITLNSGATGIGTSGKITMNASGAISLNAGFSATGTTTLNADDGINVNGDFSVNGSVFLDGDANSLADGNDTITFASGITLASTGGQVVLGKSVALGAITLNAREGLTLNGAFTSNGATIIDADTDFAFGGGLFTLASGAALNTNNNTLSINALDVDLQGTIDAGSSGVTISIEQPAVGTQGKIQLGDNTSCPTCRMQISSAELQNITAASLTLDNSGGAIFVDNITAANSDNIGTVILNSTADTLFRNNASTFNALTVNSKATVDVDISLTTDTGDMILNADTDSTGGTDRIFFVFDPTLTSAGNIVLNSSSGAAGIDANSSVTMISGGTITVNDDFTAGVDATLNADNGIVVNGDFVANKNIILNGDANSLVDGSDTIVFADGVLLQSNTGSISLNTSQALGVITVNAGNGISLGGNFFTSSGMTQFNADMDAATSVGGLFSIASGTQLITNNNDLVIIARDIDLQGTIDAGSGNATISISQPAVGTQGKIQLGDNTFCPTCAMQISGAELQNITASTLTFQNDGQAIFVDNITAANSDNIGTVILNSTADTLFRNNASTFNALTVNSKATVDVDISLTTDTGDMILNADTDSTGGTDRIFFVFDPTLTSAGNIVLNSSSGAAGIDANSSVTMISGGTITVNDDFTAGVDATLNADNGIAVNGDFTASKIISLDGNVNGLVDGNDTITFASGVTLESTSSSVTLGQSVALGAITLSAQRGITLNDDFTSNGLTTIDADTNFALGTGLFTIGSGATLNTNNNTLSINAHDIDLQGNINTGSADVTLSVSNNGTIGLGNATGGMTLDGLEIQNITASNLTLGTASNISVDGVTAANSNNIGAVTLNSGGDISFDNNDSVFNALALNADNDINVNTNLETDTGNFAAVADADLNSSGDFNLGLGTTLTSAVDIDVTAENANLNGNLVAGGTITINGIVNTGGDIVISAADGISLTNDVFNNGKITIDADTDRNGVGDFEIVAGKIVKSFDNDISITANDFIISGTLDAGTGTLTLLSSVAGSTIGIGNAAGSIVISGAELQNMTAANLVIGSALNNGVAVDGVTAADLIDIGAVSLASGSDIHFNGSDSIFNVLGLNAGGSIATAGATIIATALTASSVTGMNISAQVGSLDFTNTGSGDVTVNNSGAISLVGSNSAGSLSVTANGAVTQSGALAVSGATSINAAGQDVTLSDVGNDFTGAVSVTGANVSLVDVNAIDLGASTITGTLSLTAGGTVTDNGSLDIAGAAIISAIGFDVTLDDTGSDFNGTISVAGANVTLVDSDDITIGTSTITGALTIAAGDGVTIDGAVVTSGVTSINSDSDGDINGNFSVTVTGSLFTNDNDLSIISRDIDLQGTVNAGLGNASIGISQLAVGSQGKIQLGDNTSCLNCAMQISGAELQNITASSLTLENSSQAIFVDNITAANSDNIGTVILNSTADTLFRNNASTFNALTVNSKATVDVDASLTTDTGDMILNADTDSTGGTDRIFFVFDPTLTSAGDIVLNSSSGAPGIDANGSVTMIAGGSITVNDDFTAGVTANLLADDGININGNFTTPGSIFLDGDANGIVDGNDTITFADGFNLASTAGSVWLGNTIALGAITINARDGVTLGGNFNSFGLTTIDADTDVAFGAGTFAVATGATLKTNNNTLLIRALDIDLQGNVDVGSGDATITVAQPIGGTQNKIQLGDSTLCPTCTMQLSGAELQNITASTLTIKNTGQAIFVDNVTAANSDNIGTVILSSEKDTLFQGNASTFNALTVNANGAVDIRTGINTDTGDMTFNADADGNGGVLDGIFFKSAPTLISAGDLTLNSSSGVADIQATGSVTMHAAGTLNVNDNLSSTSVLTLTADNGINANGDLTTTGTIYIDADANGLVDGNDTLVLGDGITIENFTGSIDLNSVTSALGSVTIRAANGINVNNSFTSQGATTFNSDSDANGTGTFTVASTGSVLTNGNTLSITADDVNLAGTLNASDITLLVSDGGTIGLGNAVGDMTIDGTELQNITAANLNIGNSANGNVTVDGVTLVDLVNIGSVALNSGGSVDFSGAASTFKALSVDQSSAINVNTALSTSTGALDFTSSGDINVNASVASATTSAMISGGSIAGAGLITATQLTTSSISGTNISTQVGSLNFSNSGSGDVTVNNAGALSLSGFNSAGNLAVTTTGALTQSAALAVSGTTDINASGFDITLNDLANDFTGALSVIGSNVSLINSNSLDLGASTITGSFDVTAGGAVTDSGVLNVAGATTVNATGQDVTLDDAANDFTGTVSVTGANVTLVDASAIDLGSSNVNGNLFVTAGGAVTQSGTLSIADMTMISAIGQEVILTDGANDFIGDVGIVANNVQISDANSISFKASTLTGGLTVNANDGVTINGAVSTSAGSSINADSDANGSGLFSVMVAGSILTNDNTLSITADDLDLQGTLSAGLSDITILISDNGTIGLGDTVGDMTIDGGELQNIFAANLTLGSTTNGNVTVDGITAANSDNIGTVTINSGGNIDFVNNDSVFNALNVHAVTDINVNTNLETDTGSFVAIADFENNTIGDFNLGTGTTVTSALDIDITAENVNLSGDMVAGGTITINGEIFADDPIFLSAVDGIIITEDINNNADITIDADSNNDGIGDFELVGGVLIKSNDYDISITANDFIIDGIIDAGLGNVTLISSVGGTIGVGEAWGNIRIDNSELQNITAGNLIVGDENNSNVYVKNVQAVDVANISELTLNSTKAGKSVVFYGPASNLNDLTVNATNDVRVYGSLTAKDTMFNAGDDVRIHGTTHFGDLTVNAGDDISVKGSHVTTGTATLTAVDDISLKDTLSINNLNATAGDDIHVHGLLTVTGDGNLDAGDDIHLHGNNAIIGSLNAVAGDDLHAHGVLAVGQDGSLVAGDNMHLHGTNSFGGSLFAAANGDIRSHGGLTVTGSSSMSAGNDIYMNGQFNSGAWTAFAGDDIRLKGDYNLTTADLKANDEIRIDRATINSGNFSAEADFDNNDSGAFKLEKHSSITSTGDIDLSGYGLKIKGSLSAAGTLTLTDKSE